MYCIECKHPKNRTVNIYQKTTENIIRRRRECHNCGHRWTTYEAAAEVFMESKDPIITKFFGDDQ